MQDFVRLVAHNVAGIVHGPGSGFVLGIAHFDAVKVEDGLPACVERKALHLATLLSSLSTVGIIFGPTGHKVGGVSPFISSLN